MEALLHHLAEDWGFYLGGLVLGFGIGGLAGLFGVGGGFMIVPMLNVVFGLPMPAAVGTGAANVFGASLIALIRRLDRKMHGVRVALCMGVGLFPGTWFGVRSTTTVERMAPLEVFGKALDQEASTDLRVLAVYLFLLVGISGWLFIDGFLLRRNEDDEDAHRGLLARLRIPLTIRIRSLGGERLSVIALLALGFLTGFLCGFLGIGGGVFLVPLLHYIVGQKMDDATRTSLMVVTVGGLLATVGHILAPPPPEAEYVGQFGDIGNVHCVLAVVLVAGSFFGSKFGNQLGRGLSGGSLKRYFAFVVLAAALIVVYKIAVLLS